MRPDIWNLRSARSLAVLRRALLELRARADFRVAHFSVQGNHLHLLVEAGGSRALSSGLRSLGIRLAKGLNRMMGRRGAVLGDRCHVHVLRTPREVRNALAYVLLNQRSHRVRQGERPGPGVPDPFSSAAAFDGWKGDGPTPRGTTRGSADPGAIALVSPPRTWLLARGWRRAGLLSLDEIPSTGKRARGASSAGRGA